MPKLLWYAVKVIFNKQKGCPRYKHENVSDIKGPLVILFMYVILSIEYVHLCILFSWG